MQYPHVSFVVRSDLHSSYLCMCMCVMCVSCASCHNSIDISMSEHRTSYGSQRRCIEDGHIKHASHHTTSTHHIHIHITFPSHHDIHIHITRHDMTSSLRTDEHTMSICLCVEIGTPVDGHDGRMGWGYARTLPMVCHVSPRPPARSLVCVACASTPLLHTPRLCH